MPVETIKTKHDVFISYRRNGGLALAELLYKALRDRFTPFFDYSSMRSGRFDEQIFTAIETCDDFILILSSNALDVRESANDWMRIEIKHALGNGKNLIPVLFDGYRWPNDLPDDIDEITRLQYIRYSGDDKKLVNDVKDHMFRYKEGRILVEYAESLFATYNKIKFLNRELPHDKLFVELRLKYKRKIDNQVIEEIYDSYKLLRIEKPCILIGVAGSGKSSVVRDLLLHEARTQDVIEYIPIFISLSKLSEKMKLSISLQEYASEISGFNVYEFNYIAKSGKKFLLILDGMDEVANIDELNECINIIEVFIQSFKNTKLIFTSRPSCSMIKDRNTFSIGGDEVEKYYLDELTENDRINQINCIIKEVYPRLDKNQFWNDLRNLENTNHSITEMTKNPLMLTLMLSVWEEDTVDGGGRGSFPKNKVELYERAVNLVIRDRPETQIKRLSSDLIPLAVTLLGRIAFTLYEKMQKKDSDEIETIKISDNLVRQGVKSYIAFTLKCTQENAKLYAEEFIAFIRERSIFTDNKFLHDTFQEYFAALFMYSTLFVSHDTSLGSKTELISEEIFTEIITAFSSNENTLAVIEMLLCYIDRETPDDAHVISETLDKILDNCLEQKPEYDMLCKAVSQFANHHLAGAIKLIVSMFERSCNKSTNVYFRRERKKPFSKMFFYISRLEAFLTRKLVVNPFSEMFFYLSEFSLSAGITNNLKSGDKEGLEKAYKVIMSKYKNDAQKLAIAGICYHLFSFLYLDDEASRDEFTLHIDKLNKKDAAIVCDEWWFATDAMFAWIDKESHPKSSCANLLYIDKSCEAMGVDEVSYYSNVKFIKVNLYNKFFTVDDSVLYSADKSVLLFHIRKGMYPCDFAVPTSVKEVADFAFYGCTQIEKLVVQSPLYIADTAFRACTKLRDIEFSDVAFYIKSDVVDFSTMKFTYPIVFILNEETKRMNGFMPDLNLFSAGNSTEEAKSDMERILYTFIEMSLKYSVEMPRPSTLYNIREIWQGFDVSQISVNLCPFSMCDNIQRIVIPKSVVEIPKGMFPLNPNLKIICYPGSYGEKYAIDNNIFVEYISE